MSLATPGVVVDVWRSTGSSRPRPGLLGLPILTLIALLLVGPGLIAVVFVLLWKRG
jgi:hypothetical protein